MHNSNRPAISTHVLDTTRGEPAAGVPVTLARVEGGTAVDQSTQETDADGRIRDLAPGGFSTGAYRLTFDVAAYFRKRGDKPAFLSRVVLEFDVADARRGYHVPLLVSPYACASYRGS